MPWVALDDQIFMNKKVARCDPGTKLLYIVGLVYCGNQLTDGYIEQDTLPLLAGMAGIDLAIAKQNASKLCSIGLWDATADQWHIPDYLDYNPSRDEVLHKKAVRAAAGKLGGMAKASKSLANAKANAKQNPSKIVPPTPSPSHESEMRDRTPAPLDPFPEQSPEYREALRKLDANWPGMVGGPTQLKLTRIWGQVVNGKANWIDDAIIEAKARDARTPDYAVQVLATALRDNKRPGETTARQPARAKGRDLDALLGITTNGKP